MTQIGWVKKYIEYLALHGVQEYVVCAGARNAAFLKVLNNTKGIKVYSFFEERSAGFFALGRIKKTNRPVVVSTTSGTAVGNLLPSVMEAYHSQIPLIVTSADRPLKYRFSGAPQTANQQGIFSNFASTQDFTELNEYPNDMQIFSNKPTHINICFDEPLIDDVVENFSVERLVADPEPLIAPSPKKEDIESISLFFRELSRPLLYVSGLKKDQLAKVSEIVQNWRGPVYIEAQSNLKLPIEKTICGEWGLKQISVDGVVRIGSVPTSRYWRDLEDLKLPVINFSDQKWLGLSYLEDEVYPISLLQNLEVSSIINCEEKFIAQTELWGQLQSALEKFPESEANYISCIQQLIEEEDQVFIGNSMPIRYWDLTYQLASAAPTIFTQRGLNGIDGLISTGLGLADEKLTTWIVLGDLSTLYDLSGVWPLLKNPTLRIKILIINNGGGKIFQRVFNDPSFENRHGLGFASWAKMWGLSYKKINSSNEIKKIDETVIEYHPDNLQSKQFWNEMSC